MILKVKVIKAILTHNTQIGSQMDPYLLLKYETQSYRSPTLQEAGDMPEFNQSRDFIIQPDKTTLHLIVYDEDNAVDDLVGEVSIDLKPILIQPITERKWYSLKYDGKKPAGKIMIEFTCTRNGQLEAPTKQQIKQIMKPNIHPIGIAPQNLGKRQLYGVQTNCTSRTINDYERKLNAVNSQRNIGKLPVYSFRTNSASHLHENWQNNNTQKGLPTTYTQTVSNNSNASSNSSIGCRMPTYSRNNKVYQGSNSNYHQQDNRKIYTSSHQQPQYQQDRRIVSNQVVHSSSGWCNGWESRNY